MDMLMRGKAEAEERRSIVIDSAVAATLSVLVWIQLALPRFAMSGGPAAPQREFRRPLFVPHPPASAWMYALVAVCFLPLALRRRYPLSVLVAVAVASAAFSWLPHPPALTLVAVLIALYTVGTLYPRKQLALATAATAAVTLPATLPQFGTTFWVAEVVRIVALLAAAAFLGDATRNRRAYVVEVERRALDAERTRDEEARRRVDEERLRIARDLHDITAHSLSLIAVQSNMAKHVIRKDRDRAAKALETISETSRSALHELRAVIGVLRGVGEPEGAPLSPAPSLTRLSELTGPLEKAGLNVQAKLTGDADALPSLVDASAYRIVQEALTNVVRHAEASGVVIRIEIDEDEVRIAVRDDGRGLAPHGGGPVEGHGIPGMRERALALGGTFSAEAVSGGGFEVNARLPVKGVGV